MDDPTFLRELFKKLDEQKRVMRLTEGVIKSVGKRYSKSKGYIVPLDTYQLRYLAEKEADNG